MSGNDAPVAFRSSNDGRVWALRKTPPVGWPHVEPLYLRPRRGDAVPVAFRVSNRGVYWALRKTPPVGWARIEPLYNESEVAS